MLTRKFLVLFICFAVFLSACALFLGEGKDPYANVIHQVSEGGVAAPEDVTSVSEVGWEWHPGEGESTSEVHAGPVGAVVELTDGLVGLRGDTGEELWTYRIPEAEGFSASFSPSGEQALVTASDEPATLLDTETGATVAEDVDWDGETLLLDEARLLDYRGEATELLFEVSGLESAETLWQQETTVESEPGGILIISRTDMKADTILEVSVIDANRFLCGRFF